MTTLKKVWGYLNTIFETKKCKVDVLYLDENTACSIHHHEKKSNRFVMVSGSVKIKSDLGEKILAKNEVFDVNAGITHQFVALEDSILIEIAYVNKGILQESDIVRKIQGGKYIKDKFYTLDELKDKYWLDFKNVE